MIFRYSKACEDTVKRFEDGPGFASGQCSRLESYRCPAGIWTVAWGHTDGVCEGIHVSPQQADQLLREDLDQVCRDFEAILPGDLVLTQGQMDGLCSLAMNLKGGARAIPQVAPKLYKAVLSGDLISGAHEFLDIDHAIVNGRSEALSGLQSRRHVESLLFLGGNA